jgi:hypothetical protein
VGEVQETSATHITKDHDSDFALLGAFRRLSSLFLAGRARSQQRKSKAGPSGFSLVASRKKQEKREKHRDGAQWEIVLDGSNLRVATGERAQFVLSTDMMLFRS